MRIQAFHPLTRAVGWLASGMGMAISLYVTFHDPEPSPLTRTSFSNSPEPRDPRAQISRSLVPETVTRTNATPLSPLPEPSPLPDKHRDDHVGKTMRMLHALPRITAPIAPQPIAAAMPPPCLQAVETLADRTKIYFDQGAATVPPIARAAIRVLGAAVHTCPDVTLTVLGSADPSGDPNINRALSWQRARAVMEELKIIGVTGNQVKTKAQTELGPRFFVVDRRVDFRVAQKPRRTGAF